MYQLTFSTLCILSCVFGYAQSFDATLFDDINYGGNSLKVSVEGGCKNVLEFNDRTSSVKTTGCIRLWEHRNCVGHNVDVNPDGTDSLPRNNFNDKVTSVSSCDFDPPTGLQETVEIEMHLNGANDLQEHATNIQRMMREWFPFIQNNLLSPFYTPVKRIDVYFDVKDNGIYAGGSEIHIPIDYVRGHKDDTGVFIHEMTHVIHQARSCPGWVVEGMAEYMRRWFYEPKTTKTKPTSQKLDNDYLGDWLLVYLNTVMKRPIIYTINRACQEGTWRTNFLRDLTGKDEQEWWRIMVNDNEFPWKKQQPAVFMDE